MEEDIDDGWLDIADAPKNGKWIMLGKVGQEEVLIAFWHRTLGCWWGQSGQDGLFKKWQDATHWRDMPASPRKRSN